MSSQAPWSIKGVDKDTREKMKLMAQEQGMSLADFLGTLMNASANISKDNIAEKMHQAEQDVPEIHQEHSENFDDSDAVLSMDSEDISDHQPVIHNFSETTEQTIEPTKIIEQSNVAPLKQETPVVAQEIKAKPKKSPIKEKSVVQTEQQLPQKINLFSQLTQKVGITNSALSESPTNNITETVMRERQLRDMMRVQMTEMRQMFNHMLEEAVDKKFDQIKNILAETSQQTIVSVPTQGDATITHVMPEDYMNKNEFLEIISAVTNEIDQKIESKLGSQLERLHHLQQKNHEMMQNEFVKISQNIVEHSESKVSHLINEALVNHSFTQSDLSGGDLAIFSALKDNADVLSSRMARIEDACLNLDEKLSHLQSDMSYTLQPEPQNNHALHEMQNIRHEIEDYLKGIPEFLDEALKKNSNNMSPIINTLQMTSEKIIKLENMVKSLSMQIVDNNASAQKPVSHHLPLFQETPHEAVATAHVSDMPFVPAELSPREHHQAQIQNQNEWADDDDEASDDDNEQENNSKKKLFENLYELDNIDTPQQHNPHDFLSDSEEEQSDIRELDKNAFLSGARKNFEKKMTEKKNDAEKKINLIEQIGGTKNLVLFGTMGVTVFILLTLVFQ